MAANTVTLTSVRTSAPVKSELAKADKDWLVDTVFRLTNLLTQHEARIAALEAK
jgi:glycine cleavage system regulatory protein